MPDHVEVVLWRAPRPGCRYPEREVLGGYEPADYPGAGVFFARYKPIADSFRQCYQNGLQEIRMSLELFDMLVEQGVMEPDTYYPSGQSWHVPSARLPAFNRIVQQGKQNVYHRQPTEE